VAVVIADSSALIALQRVGRLELLHGLFSEVVVPGAVAREVKRGGLAPPSWLKVHELRRETPPELYSRNLGGGEREVIALALELGTRRVALDDLAARRVAREQGLDVVGTAALLYLAKRRGLLEAVRPALDELLAEGFRLSPTVYATILEAAGEGEPS
jgi:predicted nucleic acid-binding protein